MRRIACSSLLVLSAIAAAEEAEWQTSAEGLTEGPLCSLVLQVEMGETLELSVPGGTNDGGWSTLAPCPIPLGTIGRGKVAGVERSGDWSHAKAVATLGGGEKLTLIASMLSPAILVETSGGRLRLFGGAQPHMASVEKGKLKVHSTRFKFNAPVMGPITPPFLAVPQGDGLRVFRTSEAIGLPPRDNAWALAWWGKSSHFLRSDRPIDGLGHHPNAYVADCPLLLLFDGPPSAIAAAKDGGLDFAFAESGRRVLIFPMAGAGPERAEETQKWAEAFPANIAKRLLERASHVRRYPVSVREGFRYDAASDEAAFTEKVAFLEVGSGGRQFAPLPPVAAIAKDQGLPVATSAALGTLGIATEFGPIFGANDTDTLTWSVRGLGKYAAVPRAVEGKGKAPAALEAELKTQIDKLLGAGRLLAPWAYADNVPISNSRGEYYWGEPGEELHLFCEIHAALSPQQQTLLAEYMAALREAHPPESRAIVPPDAGAARGGYDLGPCNLSKLAVEERGKRVGLFALYGLARYCATAGTKPDAKAWRACKKILSDAFEEQAWATLYLLGHPNRSLPWQRKPGQKGRPSAHWRGDRPAAVVNANRQFAGAIGAVRLARLAGDAEAEQQAWWLLARAAVLRHAMGKYAAWRYRAGLASLPKNPDWFWKWKQRGPQTWKGDLETDRWASPADDVCQVVELAPDRVELGYWAGVLGDGWMQRCTAQLTPFRHMTPELALFLRDHLRAESAAFVALVEWNHPVWYASFAEAIIGWEHNMSHPSDAHQLFMARAQILGEKPEQLAKWLDVPWLERGDLHYIHKLAETIKAYRGVKWEGMQR